MDTISFRYTRWEYGADTYPLPAVEIFINGADFMEEIHEAERIVCGEERGHAPLTPEELYDSLTENYKEGNALIYGCTCGVAECDPVYVQIAVDAIVSARCAHSFLGATKSGHAAIVNTYGNKDCHLILRGGNKGPNYDATHVKAAIATLAAAHVPQNVMVDCSHANSNKQHLQQMTVAASVGAQIAAGNRHIIGVMAESNLVEGAQKLEGGQPLTYGQSITDACIGWEDTEKLLALLADAVTKRQAIPAS